MAAWTRELEIPTQGNNAVIDLTDECHKALTDSDVEPGGQSGTLTVFAPHTTVGVTTLEFEPGANSDLGVLLERLVPQAGEYAHNRMDSNGHAHARAAIMGASVTVPVIDGTLALGTWQHVALVDFDDRPRVRRILLQFVG